MKAALKKTVGNQDKDIDGSQYSQSKAFSFLKVKSFDCSVYLSVLFDLKSVDIMMVTRKIDFLCF